MLFIVNDVTHNEMMNLIDEYVFLDSPSSGTLIANMTESQKEKKKTVLTIYIHTKRIITSCLKISYFTKYLLKHTVEG